MHRSISSEQELKTTQIPEYTPFDRPIPSPTGSGYTASVYSTDDPSYHEAREQADARDDSNQDLSDDMPPESLKSIESAASWAKDKRQRLRLQAKSSRDDLEEHELRSAITGRTGRSPFPLL